MRSFSGSVTSGWYRRWPAWRAAAERDPVDFPDLLLTPGVGAYRKNFYLVARHLRSYSRNIAIAPNHR
jgi:hypothetical protein